MIILKCKTCGCEDLYPGEFNSTFMCPICGKMIELYETVVRFVPYGRPIFMGDTSFCESEKPLAL